MLREDNDRRVLALATALSFVFLVPVRLLAVDGAVGSVPTAVVDGFLKAVAAPLTSLGLHQGVIETRLCSVKGLASKSTLALHRGSESGGVLGGEACLQLP